MQWLNIRPRQAGCLGLNPALPSGKSLVLSEPNFLICIMGMIIMCSPHSFIGRVRLEECVAHSKHSRSVASYLLASCVAFCSDCLVYRRYCFYNNCGFRSWPPGLCHLLAGGLELRGRFKVGILKFKPQVSHLLGLIPHFTFMILYSFP